MLNFTENDKTHTDAFILEKNNPQKGLLEPFLVYRINLSPKLNTIQVSEIKQKKSRPYLSSKAMLFLFFPV